MNWPLGAKWRHNTPHGATLTRKNLNHFNRLFGFKSPSSHFFVVGNTRLFWKLAAPAFLAGGQLAFFGTEETRIEGRTVVT